MSIFDRVMGWLDERARHAPAPTPSPRAAMDADIDRCIAKMKARGRALDLMEREASRVGACCPTCRFGDVYADASEAQKRTGRWLCVLLRKRGDAESLSLAHSIEVEAWP